MTGLLSTSAIRDKLRAARVIASGETTACIDAAIYWLTSSGRHPVALGVRHRQRGAAPDRAAPSESGSRTGAGRTPASNLRLRARRRPAASAIRGIECREWRNYKPLPLVVGIAINLTMAQPQNNNFQPQIGWLAIWQAVFGVEPRGGLGGTLGHFGRNIARGQ